MEDTAAGGTAVAEAVTVDVTAPAVPEGKPGAPSVDATPAEKPAASTQDKLLNRREAKDQMRRDRAEQKKQEAARKAAEAKVDVAGRKHAPDGKYLPGDGETPKEAEGAKAPAVQDTTPPPAAKPQAEEKQDTSDKSAADTPAGGGIRIEIDPKHPVAGMGLAALTAANEQEAQVVRALLNGVYTRRQEVDAANARATAAEAKARELQDQVIGHESTNEARKKFQSTPQYRERVQKFHQIREEFGEEDAKAYWRGVEGEYQEFVKAERETREIAVREQEEQALATRWRESELGFAKNTLGERITGLPDFDRIFHEEVELFNDRLEKGRYPQLNIEPRTAEEANQLDQATKLAFRRLLTARLRSEPSVREAMRTAVESESRQKAEDARKRAEEAKAEQARLEAARREGAEAHKRAAADARLEAPPNPIGNLPAPDGRRRSGVDSEPEAEDTRRMGPAAFKKHSKYGARQDAARHLKR